MHKTKGLIWRSPTLVAVGVQSPLDSVVLGSRAGQGCVEGPLASLDFPTGVQHQSEMLQAFPPWEVCCGVVQGVDTHQRR